MTAVTPRPSGSRIRARLAVLAVVGVIAAIPMVALPDAARAAGTVTPMVDCFRDNGDGTLWVVVGYRNTTGERQNYGYGAKNQVHPSRLQREQPQRFETGTVHGAWRVLLSYDEIFRQDARWVLDGTTLRYADRVQYATVCPPSTVLPVDGNGIGTAVAVVGAGAVGAIVLARFHRRLDRLATQAASVTTG